jgi:hypothetical protein
MISEVEMQIAIEDMGPITLELLSGAALEFANIIQELAGPEFNLKVQEDRIMLGLVRIQTLNDYEKCQMLCNLQERLIEKEFDSAVSLAYRMPTSTDWLSWPCIWVRRT